MSYSEFEARQIEVEAKIKVDPYEHLRNLFAWYGEIIETTDGKVWRLIPRGIHINGLSNPEHDVSELYVRNKKDRDKIIKRVYLLGHKGVLAMRTQEGQVDIDPRYSFDQEVAIALEIENKRLLPSWMRYQS